MATPFTDPTKLGIVGNLNPSSNNTPKVGIVGKLQENIYNPKHSGADYIGYDTSIDVDRYKRFIDEIYPGVNLERQAAQGQSPWGKIGNMFVQGVIGEILAQGIIGGAGSIASIPETILDSIHKEEADFGNFMTKFADSISNTLSESAPIFRYNEGKTFDWKDLGWWTSQGVSFFSTIGLLIPALGEAKAASYFSKALRSLAGVAKVKGVAKGVNLAADVFNTEKYWQKITHSAIAMRNAENVRESSQAYTTIYNETLDTIQDDTKFQELLNSPIGQEFLSRGNNPDKNEFAKFIASKAAWKNYIMNAANVVFDMMQLAPLFKGFKIKTAIAPALTSKAVKTAQKSVVEGVSSLGTKATTPGFNVYPFIKGGTVLVGEQLSEGAEELVNAISQSEANWYGKYLIGSEKDEGKQNRYNAYLNDPSSWEQAFWGFAGGVAFSGVTRGLDKIQNLKNDTVNPYSDAARIQEIQNRYIKIGNTGRSINAIINGFNPNSEDGIFKGTDAEIEQQKKDAIDELRTLSTYDLTFEAARHGNVDLLLDMINHDNFKQQYIGFGLADETNFNAIHAKLVQDINDAEYTYKNIYNNIFTATYSKPWLREVIISNGIKTKAKLASLIRQRDTARTNASNLKASSPAYAALKEQNKDKDFSNTLDNLISNAAIKHIEKEITTDDHVVNRVLKNSVATLKQELREKHNLIKDKQAEGDFNSIKDIIENEAIAKILDICISAQNSLYEEVVNTNKSIPIIEKDFKEALTNLNNKNLEVFRNKVSTDTEVNIKDTKEDIETKINSLKSQIETLNKTKKNPLLDPNNPASNLDENYLKSYINILENRLKYLYQEQNKATSREVVLQATKDANDALVSSLQSLFNSLKIDTVKVKFSGKPSDTTLVNNIQNYINKGSANLWSTINKLINDTEFNKQLIKEGTLQNIYDKIKEELSTNINNAYRNDKLDELIDALLRGIGYQVIDYKKVDKTNEVVDLLNQFKSTLTEDKNIKASVDFNAINPLNKNQVDLANKLMTRIINSGKEPLFDETRPTVTFWFKPIAAQYARITSIEQLVEDIDVLKAAYGIIREAKINPVTGTKYRYNTIKYIDNITAKDIIEEFDLQNESYEYSSGDDEYLEKTGGKDSINTYIFDTKFDFTIDDNGNLIISDKDRDRFDTLLNGVEKDTPVTVQVNTNFLSRKDQKQYSNNSDFIPLVVTVNNKGKNIEIASINTMATDHYGVEYDFKKKDWTNVILDDINESNTKAQRIVDLVPQLQNWYNLNRINADSEKINEAYEQLLDADSFGIINEMLGKLTPRTEAGQKALYHISKVIFYGENTDGNSEVASNRFNIINNIRNWKNKLYRDYQGNKKIRNTIGTDATKTINTKVTYVTSGTVLTTKGKKFNNLSIVGRPKNIKLFRLADKRTLVNTRDTNETINKTKGQYSNSLFVGVPTPRSTNETKYIPVPVRTNTLNGSLLSSENDDLFLDKIVSLIEELGRLRVSRVNDKSSELATKINDLEKKLAEVVRVDYEDNGNINAIISNNKDIRFYSGDRYIIYNYYSNKFEYEREVKDGIARKDISREEFKKELGKLNRQVDYKSLGKTQYIDILGNKHNSYEDYLISTNTIVTDIAQVVDTNGNKISNFVPKTGNVGGTPLAINIDTSMLSISKNASNNFFQFQTQFQLDSKYNFIFELFNRLLTDGEKKIKFNGIVAEIKTQDGREAFAWYDPNTSSISVSKKWVEDQYNVNKENATLLIVHEILHALKGTRTAEEQKILDNKLNKFKNSILNTNEYKALRDKENKTDIDNKILAILDMKGKHIDEILTYGLTDKDFAKFLDSIKGEVEGVEKTFWTKLLDIIKELAASFGIKGSKLDELGVLFDKFISGQEIDYIEAKRAEDVKDLNKDIFDDLEDEFGSNGEISYASFSSSSINQDQVNYIFKATDILQSDRAKQIFEKGSKNGWDLNKILTELQIPKLQKELLLDLNVKDREELILELNNRYGFVIESKIIKRYHRQSYDSEIGEVGDSLETLDSPINTEYYHNLTVPGGTNYTENEISTPAIFPSIKGHAQFSTVNGIGWFRSDEQGKPLPNKEITHYLNNFVFENNNYSRTLKDIVGGKEWEYFKNNIKLDRIQGRDEFESKYKEYYNSLKSIKNNTRRILEIQSDLFQKGRDKEDLTKPYKVITRTPEIGFGEYGEPITEEFRTNENKPKNQFLQLLNKDNNWVTFFIKSIIQDSIKKGYKKVLFPTGETAAKVEGHETIADEIRKINDELKDLNTLDKYFIKNQDIVYYKQGNNYYVDHEEGKFSINKEAFEKYKKDADNTEQISRLEKRKSELKSQGIEKLKPIEHFYTNTVFNNLKKIGTVTPITDEYDNTWNEIDLSENKIIEQVTPIKFSSFASSVNQEITGSPFSEVEEKNILNVLSGYAINILDKNYKGQKLKDFSSDAIRLDILKALTNDVQARKRNNTITSDQLSVLSKLANLLHKGDDRFWKLFRIHLSNLYGYTINDLEEYREDIEYIEKAWDQTDVYTKHPMNTANDRTKNLVNTTFEIDPLSVEILPDGNRIYKTYTNTPTGFANTLSWSRYGSKLYDLMMGSLTKEDMLDALLKYASTVDSIFAKSLYSIYDKLKADSEQLNAWFTTFDKMVVDSYRTLNRTISTQDEGDLTELNITLGNKKGSAYILANKWTNVIVSRAETDYYDEKWNKEYNDLYIQIHNLTDNFTKLNKSSAIFLSNLFNHIGIDVNYDALLGEFSKGNEYFKKNIIDPIEYLKSSPSSKEKNGYIDILQKNKNSSRNEYGNLYRLATRLEYYRDDISNHSELNVKGNLVYDLRNPNFIINFFKNLKADDNTVIEFLTPYTKVPSNQHSFLLWGDHIVDNEAVRLGSGIFNFNIVNGIKQIDRNNPLNKKNISKLKFFGYSGTKNLSEGNVSEYHELNKHDWEYEMFTYYIAKGEYEDEIKRTAIFPLLNPSDRKNTLLFEAPTVNITTEDWITLISNPDTNTAKESIIFKRLYNIMYDEIIAADVAKKLLFELDNEGRVIYEDNKPKVKQDILNNKVSSQINYHYKLDDNGDKHYLEFKNINGKLVLDTKNSGNIFGFNTMIVLDQNVQITYNDLSSTNISFIEHLLNSPNIDVALNSKVNDTQTYKDKLILFIHRFIQQQYEYTYNNFKKYESIISKTYLKKENTNKDEISYITKDKHFALWVTEFALNTYLFNVEQTRLFYGNLADYKSNSDFNKRGGEVLANGISTTLRGVFHGATISDVKLKSKIYRNIAETLYNIKTGDKLTDSLFNKFNKVYTDDQLRKNSMKFSNIEKSIYNTISPYLINDSANAVSLITLDEFIKRIDGFGLSKQYKDIIDKIKFGVELNRSEITRFASMQKNFYYDLLYNSDMGKMVPNQIKNAEVILTPNLIKDLELEDLNSLMINLGISQLNLTSAEKVGSFHIATITDKNGRLLDLDIAKSELLKAKREYRYENLRMQQELTDALYEEEITLGRQIVKKMIENIPNDVEYTVAGEILTGEDIKDLYFYLATENIYQDRDGVLLEFDTTIDEKGNLKNPPSIDKVIDVLEKMALDLSLTKNMMFGIQKGDNGLPRVPLFFGAYNTKIQNILTSISTNNINNQTFPGLHAPQMSSLFMNKKKGVRQKELQNQKGIEWHSDKGLDTKLKSTIIQDTDEFEVIAAEVLLGRWAKEFYTETGTVPIDSLPEDVRTMIGYRIPTEGKFSIYRFKVVGFLPDDGPAIVLPDEFVTQTGSDFDWDTVFALRYNLHKVSKSEEIDGKKVEKEYIETIKYISGNTANDFNERVEAVMNDRKQLVHILSKKYKSEELLDILNRLNTLRSETESISELNKTRYKDQIERIKVLDGIIKSSKGKNREALDEKYELQALVYGDSRSIPYKQKSEYLAVKNDVSQILSKLSINQQNTKKARQNRILDIYSAILTNKVHYPEIIDISNFKDITRVGQEIDELIKNPILNINNFTFEGQQKYRDLANQGRNLKGISVALDRFNSIANVIGIELNNNLDDDFGLGRINTLPKVRYRVNNSEIARLEKDYKGDIEVEKIDKTDESYVTIVHKYVANNSAGTFTGVHGNLITSYSAQTTANIVDNVAHKLPNNVGKYMIDVWKLLPSIGSTFEISTKLINQPILRELVDYYEQIAGTVSGGREIEDIKRKYQTLLYRLQLVNGRENEEFYDRAIERNRSIVIGGNEWLRNKQYQKFGYENNTRIVLDEEQLTNNIDFSNSDKILEELNRETVDPNIAKQLEDFVRYQLQILETYKIYRTYAKAISDVGMILNTDKIGAGPTFETTTELLYNIEKAHNTKVLSIKGESIMPKVFPRLFNLNTESVYPTLEAFLEASNLLSFKMFSSYFTEYSPLYMIMKRRIHEYIGKTTYDKKLSKSITEYLDNSLLKDLPWFNTLTIEDKQRLLGIGFDPILKINLKEEGALQVFETLSVANQIRVYTDNYGRENSYLNALSIQLQAKNIKKNEFHKIEYNNTGNLDEHTEAFNILFYSDNIFERIIARNLIRYEYLVNGFKFGFGNFTKVIPSNVLYFGTEPFIEDIDNEKGVGLSIHLYGKLDKLNNLIIAKDISNEKLEEFSLQVFNSNYKERYLRSHWENNSLVPDAGWWRDKSGLRVIQSFGNPDGIISLPAATLQNAPTSTAMDRLKTREIIKLRYEDKWQLYKRVDSFVNFEDRNVSGTYYYYPIGKLEYYENEEQSIFPSNNLLPNGNEIQNQDDYIGLIKILNEKNKVNDLIFHLSIAMNMTRKDGQFRDGLEQYNTLIELIRVGERTATTRHADTHEAEKWATLKVGDYVNLLGTDEYIKVTKTLTHISLDSLPERQKWSEKEGWDITVAHKMQNDKDLYQFEFIYIGNKQAVIDDSKREYEAEEVEEIDNFQPQKSIRFIENDSREYKDRTAKTASADATIALAINFNTRGEQLTALEVEKQGKKYIPFDISKGLPQYKIIGDKIIEELNSLNKDQVSLNIAGNGIYTLINKYTQKEIDSYLYDILKYVYKNPYLKCNIINITSGGQTGIDEAGAKAGFELGIRTTILAPNKWKFRVTKKMFDEQYKGKKLIQYKINNDNSVDISSESAFKARFGVYFEDDQLSFKFSSYSSSVSPEINNAITTANDFVKTTYGNLTVRSKIYDYSKSTRETVEALDALDIAEELTSLHLADLSTALIHILNYMRIELLTPKSEKKIGIVARLSEYENENMYELVNDPIKRREFINTMSYTLSFLRGVITFDKLESTGNTNLTKDEQLVNEQIKELQNLLPLIKNTRSKFDRLLKYFSEVNLKKYTTNPEILDGTRNIMDPGDDESYVQLQLDALADTNNPFIANMVKQFSINMIKADDASTVDVGELEALLRKTFNKNITSLTADDFRRYLEYKNGRPTGKLVQKYNWDKFYTDKNNYFEQIKKQYGKGSDEYRSKVREWYKNNEITVVTEEEIDEIIAQKEKDLSKSAFYKWKKSNLRVENNKRAVRIGSSSLATPIDKYINPEWTKIKDDPLYQKFIEIIDRYTDHFGKETILTRGFIPTMTPEAKRLFNPKEIVEKWISENKAHRESESFVGENNEMVYILTVPMVNYFTQEKEIKISNKREGETENEHIIRVLEETRQAGRGDFKSIYEILAENRKIRKENDDYHAGKIDYNLGNVFSKFIHEANRYKAKAQMKREFDLALYQIRNADFYSRDSKGKLVKNEAISKALKESTYKYEPGENTNLAKHYAQWLEAIFYGNFDIDEGNWTTISKILLKFTSAKAMWLNLTAGINNVAFGKLQVRLESIAKWYFTNKDLNKADSMFMSALPDIIMNLGSTKANNLTNAIIKRFDVTQNTNERDYTTGMLKQKLLSSSTLYVFNDIGEHYMQNVSALAMANHSRIINGKIMSLADYKFNNYKKALYDILNDKEKEALDRYIKERYDIEEFKESKKDYLRDYLLALPINKSNAFIEAKKKLDATSEEEFSKHPRLIDAFYLDENGYAQLQNEIEIDGKKINTSLDKDEFAKFRIKALKVVQKEQGIYNKEDAGMMQRRGLGKLMIQFRKYMRPGWNKRFGTKIGRSFWTESRDEWDKGMYISVFNFLKTGFKRNYDLNESKEFHGMMGKILNDMYHFATNLPVYWNTLDDFEKGNIRRVMLEQLYLVATILVATMLKGLKPEDDDDENFAYDLTVYEIDRLYSNAMMYNPIGFINEGRKILKSPAAAQGTLLDTYRLLSNLVGYPFQTPEERVYQTGVYAKENKIMVNATKLIPVLNKYQQLKRINKLNKYYILFRG